jgi:hypothetical protein
LDADPLEALLLDGDEVNRALLAESLSGLVAVDKKTGDLVLRSDYNSLDTRGKLLAYLLGVKAALLLGLAEDGTASPKEIVARTGMPKGTVNPKLTQLYGERSVSKTSAGAYFIAPHQIAGAIQTLEEQRGQ